ncbi:hypothetical protein [Aestuariivirga sp.]|jgi:hypothetical protein|uniref:hypothetical protein n=1 Tax=Aestuariivirga sp. TaxID=2650926 RepID=UPI003783B134
MARTINVAQRLRKVISALEELASIVDAQTVNAKTARKKSVTGRTRRSKKDVAALRKILKAERKAGVPVAELAARHRVSAAYIYMLR